VIATEMMYLRLEVIVALFDLRFARTLAPAMGALFVLGVALAIYEWRRSVEQKSGRNLQIPTTNPLQIPAAIAFAAIFVVISVISAAVSTGFGQGGHFDVGGARRSSRHRPIRDQPRTRGSGRPLRIGALCCYSDRGLFE
jgi:hypothetical protein